MFSALIVDSQALLRRGLRQVLMEEFRGVTLGEAGAPDQAVAALELRRWSLVLLGLTPAKTRMEVLRAILQRRSDSRVIILVNRFDAGIHSSLVQSGARGVLGKDAACSDIVEAVRTVLTGRAYVYGSNTGAPPTLAAEDKFGRLSPREKRVLSELAAGKSLTSLAGELHLSVKTISTFKRRILNKLALETTSDLVRFVIDRDQS
jgi:two-component system, NarL family, invasion response regulator UvrY